MRRRVAQDRETFIRPPGRRYQGRSFRVSRCSCIAGRRKRKPVRVPFGHGAGRMPASISQKRAGSEAMAKLNRDGVNIYYEVHGTGPALILTHGYSATAQMWK